MKPRMLVAVSFLVAVTIAPVLTTAETATTALSPADIKTTFAAGKPFTATSTMGGKIFTFVFNPDGTATRNAKGSQTLTTGAWRLNRSGYCSRWETSNETCYTVEKSGNKYNVKDSTGHTVSRWSAPL